jgi:hypothetical protein
MGICYRKVHRLVRSLATAAVNVSHLVFRDLRAGTNPCGLPLAYRNQNLRCQSVHWSPLRVQSLPNWTARAMSAFHPGATELRTSREVRFVPKAGMDRGEMVGPLSVPGYCYVDMCRNRLRLWAGLLYGRPSQGAKTRDISTRQGR